MNGREAWRTLKRFVGPQYFVEPPSIEGRRTVYSRGFFQLTVLGTTRPSLPCGGYFHSGEGFN